MAEVSPLQFAACQWLKCVESIQGAWAEIPFSCRLEIHYEDLITDAERIVANITRFLDVETDKDFYRSMPRMKSTNFNKWRKEFSVDQLKDLSSVLTPKLLELGYARDENWYNEIVS